MMKLFAFVLFFALQLEGQVGWITFDPPAGLVGVGYSFQLQASSAQSGLTYALQSGTLPTGITLSSGGLLSGSTTQSGTFAFTARAAVSARVFSDRLFRLLIVNAPPPVTFFPLDFPTGNLGLAYQTSFAATGLLGEMQFSILSGALPPGLRMERETGASVRIVGTPTVAGRYAFSIRTIDSFTAIKDFNFVIVITGTSLKILPDSVPAGTVGFPYEVQLSGEGGSAPYRFEKVGPFANYQLSTTGLLGLNLGTEEIVNLRVAMIDALGAKVEKNYVIPFSVGSIQVLTQTLPEVSAYFPYETTLSIQGGLPPYVCTQVGGSLPSGLSLGQDCVVKGTAQQEGNFSFVVSVAGKQGLQVEATIRLTSKVSALSFKSSPEQFFGPYSYSASQDTELPSGVQIQAQGGKPPYTFSLIDSAGPPGMKLLTNGEFYGRLKDFRLGSNTVEVVDSLGNTARLEINGRVLGYAYAGPGSHWVPGIVGEPYRHPNGRPNAEMVAPVRYRVDSGTFPPGLKLLPDGVVVGEPTVAGFFNFVLEAAGADGISQGIPSSILIESTLMQLTDAYPNFTIVGRPYSGLIRAHGGRGPYQYKAVPGLLPQGLSLSTDGRLQGTLNVEGALRFPVIVTDSRARTITFTVTIYVGGSTVTITTPERLPDLEVGRPFQMQLAASGGSGGHSFNVLSCCGALSIDTRGIYLGIPRQAGEYEFVLAVTASNSSGFGLKVMRQTVREVPGVAKDFSDVILPNARRDQPYTEWLGFEEGPVYSIRPDIPPPPGLSLSASGLLSGTLKRFGTYTFPVLLEYAAQRGVRYQRLVTVSVVGSGPFIAGSSKLPRVQRNAAFSTVLGIAGGDAPYAVTLQAGVLPMGLRVGINSAGQIWIEGVARDVGVYSFALLVSDRSGNRNSLNFELNVTDTAIPLGLDFSSVNRGVVGSAYSGAVKGIGGLPPYRFEVSSGNVLAGLRAASRTTAHPYTE
jgi:hypothetical protein